MSNRTMTCSNRTGPHLGWLGRIKHWFEPIQVLGCIMLLTISRHWGTVKEKISTVPTYRPLASLWMECVSSPGCLRIIAVQEQSIVTKAILHLTQGLPIGCKLLCSRVKLGWTADVRSRSEKRQRIDLKQEKKKRNFMWTFQTVF